ncbi:MAG: glycosyltransferase family 1 protein [Chitinivibrionales bacterium]|nr:glycosyltransferase family 1 protein [Chitinivibrionales bacterium]
MKNHTILWLLDSHFATLVRSFGFRVINLRSATETDTPLHPDDTICDFFTDPSRVAGYVQECVLRFNPDILIQGDDSTPLIHCGIEHLTIPKLWYAVDTHIHAWHRYYASLFDFVLYAHARFETEISAYQKNYAWLPLCFRKDTPYAAWSQRTIAASFVGTLDANRNPQRIEFLNQLKTLGVDIFCTSGDYVPIYSNSKVVINQSVKGDLNYRFFEGIGCGALLLHDITDYHIVCGLEEGKHFLIYHTPAEAADMVRWALSHEREAEEIALRGYQEVRQAHRIQHRAEVLLSHITRLTNQKQTQMTTSQGGCAATYYLCGSLDLPSHVCAFFRRQGLAAAVQTPLTDPLAPVAALIIASDQLENHRPQATLQTLQAIALPTDPFFLSLYYRTIILASLDLHDMDAARRLTTEGLSKLGDDHYLLLIEKELKRVKI